MARGLLDRALRMGEAKQFKEHESRVEAISAVEPEMELLDDAELRAEADALRERAKGGEKLDDLIPEAFALTREAARRTLGQRHYDVQMIGGMILHAGSIAEMKTGEGKTLTATAAVFLNTLAGDSVHLVTVNDYLARRDAEWMQPIYDALGVTVSAIQEGDDPPTRREKYACDVTYGTNSEFGFDYLRDNMAGSLEECVQRGHHFAIVDEVDNILIDEARTPLIISGKPEQAADLYYTFARLAKTLDGEAAKTKLKSLGESKDTSEAEYDFEYDEKHKTVAPTERGIGKAEEFLGVENLYLSEHGTLVNHLIQSLKAESLYKRGVEYEVVEGQVMIIDEFTGRILEGRRWSEGLHQAIEAKEGVAIREENQTLATITLQNYFRLYDKLSGMTGTAMTEAQEFMKIYKVPTVEIPTHRDMVRADENDAIFKTKDGKWKAVVNEVEDRNSKGQPILIGTISVETSEMLSGEFKKRGIEHVVLNAKPEYAEREGETISQAGRKGAVTIATNMAGRGVDIKLGGSPEHMAKHEFINQGLKPGMDGFDEKLAARTAELDDADRSRGRGGQGGRRPLHHRHRAPRVAPDRQPAPRPLGPPGRPRRVPLLPLRRGRPDPPLRRRADLQDPRPPRPDRRGGQRGGPRGEDAHEDHRGCPEEGRAAELPDPQARPRVRRRDERAAPDHLPLPARGARGQGHVRRPRARSSSRSSAAWSTSTRRATCSRTGTSGELQTQVRQLWPSEVDVATLAPETTNREDLRETLVADALAAYDSREQRLRRRDHAPARAGDPAPDHRQPLARAPLRDGLPARGHPPARVRPDRPAGRLQERGLHDVRGADALDLGGVRPPDLPRRRPGRTGRGPARYPPRRWPGGAGEPQRRVLRRDVRGPALRAEPGCRRHRRQEPTRPPSRPSREPPSPRAETAPPRRPSRRRSSRTSTDKIGRNDPCWCGSGKKYKKCHGA